MEIIEGDFDDVMDMYYRLSASAKRNFEAEHSLTHPLRQGVRKPAGYGEPDGHRRPRGVAEFQADRHAGAMRKEQTPGNVTGLKLAKRAEE